MKRASIDSIVRGYLFDKQLPIHYYVQCLSYALTGVQELEYDTLPTIKSVRLTLNEFAEATIPDDYVDYTRVAIEFGQYLIPLVHRPSINRLKNLSGSTQIPYPSEPVALEEAELLWNYDVYYNTAFYGVGQGIEEDVFHVIPERNVIQVYSGATNADAIHLQYLSFDETTPLSTVDKYAEAAIWAYIDWREADRQRTIIPLHEREYLRKRYGQELMKLRARLSILDKENILRILRRNFKQSPKT